MRWGTLHRTILAAALAAITVAAGCDNSQQRTGNGGIHLKTMPFTSPEAARDLFQLEFYFITERLGLGDAPLDFWKLLDESELPAAHRKTLAANGLRIGAGGELAIRRIETMLTGRDNIEIQKSGDTYARQGYPFPVPCGVAQADLPLLAVRSDGSLIGGDFATASTFFNFECLSGDRPNTIDVLVSEWIIYGDKEPQYRTMATGGIILVGERPQLFFDELKTRCRLREGQMLAVGPAAGRNLSIGEHLLVKVKQPYRYVTTILLVPRLVAPGALPPGANVAGQTTGGGADHTATGGNK